MLVVVSGYESLSFFFRSMFVVFCFVSGYDECFLLVFCLVVFVHSYYNFVSRILCFSFVSVLYFVCFSYFGVLVCMFVVLVLSRMLVVSCCCLVVLFSFLFFCNTFVVFVVFVLVFVLLFLSCIFVVFCVLSPYSCCFCLFVCVF